jgi:uncharacterized coiled-coil protein SlyX
MKKKILLALVTLVLLLSVVLSGCAGGGIPQADYDKLSAQLTDVQSQLTDAQSKLTKAQTDLTTLQSQKTTVDSDLKTAQAKVTDLEKQVADLKAKYELTGLTAAEVAAQIVKNYHETHTYSLTDLFVCSDMAAEVWNLLKTQGINALMAVGDISQSISDITMSTHAWVLAEVSPGEYLALETTAGTTVTEAKNPLYYRGWTFTSPADIKTYQQIVVKYNEGVKFHNALIVEINRITGLYNQSANQQEADKWEGVINELADLIAQKETDLNSLHAQLDGLATVLS